MDGGIGAGGGRTGTGATAAAVGVTLTLVLVGSVTGVADGDGSFARILSFNPVRRSVFCEKGNEFGASVPSSTNGTVVFRSVLVSIIETGRNRGAAILLLLFPVGSMSSDLKPRTVG